MKTKCDYIYEKIEKICRIRDHVLEENSMGEERLYSCEEGTVMWLKGIENIESITS